MKRKIFLLVIIISAMTGSVFAQDTVEKKWNVIPRIGLSIAYFEGDDSEGTDNRLGFTGGFEAEYRISKLIGVSGGLLYTMQGCKVNDGPYGDVTYKFDYLNIPLFCNFHLGKRLTLKTGLQPGFNINSQISMKGQSVDTRFGGLETKSIDVAFVNGICYEYKKMVFEARYADGLINVFTGRWNDHNMSDMDIRNSVLSITIGFVTNW